jgi:hypothetical protein
MKTTSKSQVRLYREIEEEQVKRKRKAFIIFPVEAWETVSTNEIGNDIHIKTDHKIRNVYLNGKKL